MVGEIVGVSGSAAYWEGDWSNLSLEGSRRKREGSSELFMMTKSRQLSLFLA